MGIAIGLLVFLPVLGWRVLVRGHKPIRARAALVFLSSFVVTGLVVHFLYPEPEPSHGLSKFSGKEHSYAIEVVSEVDDYVRDSSLLIPKLIPGEEYVVVDEVEPAGPDSQCRPGYPFEADAHVVSWRFRTIEVHVECLSHIIGSG